jgi:phosphoglycolate phosphatase-like HAD superfamily hydrolase
MPELKNLLLDLDGPLLDGRDRHYQCYRGILETLGFAAIGIGDYWQGKRSRMSRMDLLRLSGAETVYDVFVAAWIDTIESPEMLSLDKVQQGAIDCLRDWKEQGIGLTLVTMRKDRNALEAQLDSTGLRELLDSVLVSDHSDGGVGKADAVRRIFQGKISRENSLWVGDTEADWEAASALGCGIVLVANGLRDETYLTSLQGALVVPSIASLKDHASLRRCMDNEGTPVRPGIPS